MFRIRRKRQRCIGIMGPSLERTEAEFASPHNWSGNKFQIFI